MLEDVLIRPDGVSDEAPPPAAGGADAEHEGSGEVGGRLPGGLAERSECAATGCEVWDEDQGHAGEVVQEAPGKLAESATDAAARAGWDLDMLQEAAYGDDALDRSVETLEGVTP